MLITFSSEKCRLVENGLNVDLHVTSFICINFEAFTTFSAMFTCIRRTSNSFELFRSMVYNRGVASSCPIIAKAKAVHVNIIKSYYDIMTQQRKALDIICGCYMDSIMQ